jgi:hypothetical protein
MALALGLFFCATAATAQNRDTPFLKDESQLQPGRSGQAQFVYIDPESNFSRYDKAVVDRVELWFRDESATGGIDAAQQQYLAGYFTAALRHQLQLEFHPVEKAQPGSLRVRAAITRLSKSGASIALEVVDAVSGSRLVAVKDSQNAALNAKGSLHRVFDAWSERASERLGAFRRYDAAEAAPSTPSPH